ncbi:sodium/hydrogen exchanger [Saccharopolyspora subtropica]|uniref:Sodium/hydrogen exchanger n=1 Tax=Saccharopolyspora thermophila TaxID=89367 RepID=A0A917K8G3_9PSEU|nr:sodium:proton exchanger [Saccharopolyspora subtropica]GGJ02083.1 sodium/hydrogen exchanger [Saccharopolyspora subtropica]
MDSVFIFISGAMLLIYSAEKLIGYLAGAAMSLRISAFLLAIVFTGIEFDDIVLGVALNIEDLQDVALGLVFGTAISFTGVVLGLAAILAPVEVRVPRDYIVLFVASPLVLTAFVLTAPLTVVDGLVLLGLFACFVAYVVARESRRQTPTFRNAELSEEAMDSRTERSFPAEVPLARARALPGWANLGMVVVALAGLVIGAATVSVGTRGILEEYGIEGTIFGATIVTAVLTVEDVFLTAEPFRKGVPAIGVGNVIGSLVFSVTGKLGVILLAGGAIVVGPEVLTWHLPVLIVLTALAAYFFSTGRLKRWHGCVLLALYAVYWGVSFAVFGEAPVEL